MKTTKDIAKSMEKGGLSREEAIKELVNLGENKNKAEKWLYFYLTPEEYSEVRLKENFILTIYFILTCLPHVVEYLLNLNQYITISVNTLFRWFFGGVFEGILVIALLKFGGRQFFPIAIIYALFEVKYFSFKTDDPTSYIGLISTGLICFLFFFYKKSIIPKASFKWR